MPLNREKERGTSNNSIKIKSDKPVFILDFKPPSPDQSGGKRVKPDYFQNSLVDPFHQFRFQIGDGAGCDSSVVDGTDLVDEQIGIPDQLFAGFDPDAEWFCIVDEICRQGDDDRGGMSRIQKGLILKNENGYRFPRLRPFLRVEICQVDRSVANSRGHVPPR
jgi:hypothetical protein